MTLTEEEAKTKWCPWARVACYGMGRADLMFGHNRFVEAGGQGEATNARMNPPMARCIGRECIAWQWYGPTELGIRKGYCGLAGKP